MATYCMPTHDNVCALDIEKEINPNCVLEYFFLPVRQVSAVNICVCIIFNLIFFILFSGQ